MGGGCWSVLQAEVDKLGWAGINHGKCGQFRDWTEMLNEEMGWNT